MRITYSQWHNLASRQTILSEIYETNPKFIDISGAEISDIGLRQLLSHLEDNNNLEVLDLDGNNLTVFGISVLREFLNHHDSVISLNLNNNPVGYLSN